MQEFLAAMDEESRVICHMWLRGDEWKEIASDLGCSVQHARDKLSLRHRKYQEAAPGTPAIESLKVAVRRGCLIP